MNAYKNSVIVLGSFAMFGGFGVAKASSATYLALENQRIQAQIEEQNKNEAYREALQECRKEALERSGASRQTYWQQCTNAAQRARYKNDMDGLRKVR